MKLGRNAPCHCGSGKKYKRCHLRVDGIAKFSPTRVPPRIQRSVFGDPLNSNGGIGGVELKGTLFGKRIVVTTDATITSRADLREHLSRFNLAWSLRRIGELSAKIAGNSLVSVSGIPVADHCLPYLALVAIESSSDDVTVVPSLDDIAEAARIYNGLDELDERGEAGNAETIGLLVRLGHEQFCGPDLHNLIARTWFLYCKLWSAVSTVKHFDIGAAIRGETGLTVQQLMVLGLAYAGHSERGFSEPYADEELMLLPPKLGIRPQEHEQFLRWITASYSEIRELARCAASKEEYGKARLNPLLLKPVVRPDKPPERGADRVCLVPVPHYVTRKVTGGLYHALATAHGRGGGDNSFRVAFGHVIQSYVGELLKASSGAAEVLPEWQFGPRRKRRATPDWMVLDNTRLVVVEVKQSGLTINTKMNGDPDMLARDLQRTLGYTRDPTTQAFVPLWHRADTCREACPPPSTLETTCRAAWEMIAPQVGADGGVCGAGSSATVRPALDAGSSTRVDASSSAPPKQTATAHALKASGCTVMSRPGVSTVDWPLDVLMMIGWRRRRFAAGLSVVAEAARS